jgi:hypothetical protein
VTLPTHPTSSLVEKPDAGLVGRDGSSETIRAAAAAFLETVERRPGVEERRGDSGDRKHDVTVDH